MDSSTRAKTFVQLTGSMVWLFLLYGALLYVAVGALGVSELTRRIGEEAATVIHMVEVGRDIRSGEEVALRRDEITLTEKEALLQKAITDFRNFGVTQGMALQDIQPIIDNYDLAPKLSTSLKKSVDVDVEKQWAAVMGAMMQLQFDIRDIKKIIDGRRSVLRSAWSAHPQVATEAVRLNIDPISVDRAAATADTLQELGYARLFGLPAEILTLLLALSMGALGSTLHVTKTLLTASEERPTSYYLIRPFQGMVTSLVVFVLLKAGQLTISAGDSDNLNIFFVSFAGIASGLLAEEAYRMIRKAGAGIIKSDDAESRWAFKLGAALAANNVSPVTLAEGIRVPLAELDSWLNETHPVPPLQQRLIAAWLHIPERELFTAQPPEEATLMSSPLPSPAVP
jgi:hypothetical protein